MKLLPKLTKWEKFEGESLSNKIIKRVIVFALAGIAVGFFIAELFSFIIFLWGYFGG